MALRRSVIQEHRSLIKFVTEKLGLPCVQPGWIQCRNFGSGGQAKNREQLWRDFFTDPRRWWDHRYIKSQTKPDYPDFINKFTKEVLWIDNVGNPSWLQEKLAAFTQGRTREVEQLWEDFFADPEQWWDMRQRKKFHHHADFKNKSTGRGLWIKHELNPCWIHARLDSCIPAEQSDGVASVSAPGGQVEASTAQQPRESSGWEMMSLEEALSCLDRMDCKLPSVESFICVLQKCRKKKNLAYAKRLHAHICNNGLEGHRTLGNYIVPMFVDCGSVSDAQQVFNGLVHRSQHSWTSLILGYIGCGQSQHAINLYKRMQEDCVKPSRYTFMALLKACARIKNVARGRQIHVEITKEGFGADLLVGNTLINMYAKCGSLEEARNVFDRLPLRDVVSWNAMMAGYAEHGLGHEVLNCLGQMRLEGISPDAITFVSCLKSCGNIGAIDRGREIYAEIAERGFQSDVFVGSSLIDMFVKGGSIEEAQQVFDNLPARDVVLWTVLIAGYAEHGLGQEVLKCLERMKQEGVSPDAVTFVCSLKACGDIGAIDGGREIHAEITKKGFERDLVVASSLVDMYAKCGSIEEAREVFDKMPVRDVVLWSAMIRAYGMNHEGSMAVQCFEDMQKQGVEPDAITFTSLLGGCSRAGLVLKGQEYFKLMREKYGIAPTMEHYICMVDLLARSGLLHEAHKFVESMPWPPSTAIWIALLSACKTYGAAELGLKCFQHLIQVNPEDASAYVLMANIYASAGKWDDAHRIEELRKQAGAKKKPASAFIEVNKKVHEFVVGNNQSKEISAKLETLSTRMKEEGHVPNVDLILKPMSDEEKELALCEHAEKLAIAYGLLNTPQGQTLHVTKNMRMCINCHDGSKSISRIEKRELIVRDSYRVHHFKDGACSCGDMC